MMLRSRFFISLLFFLASLGVGSLFRYSNLFSIGYEFDTVTTQYAWAKAVADMGWLEMWRVYNGYLDYPLGNLGFIGIIEHISRLFSSGPQSFVTTLKVFYWIVDGALLITVYHFLKKHGVQDWVRWSSLGLIYLYPGLWFVSGVWGQSDTFHALLVIWSLQLLYSQKTLYQVLGGVLLGIALYFKLQILLVIGVLFLVWMIRHPQTTFQRWKKLPFIVLPAALLAAGAIYYVARIYLDHTGLYNFADEYSNYLNDRTRLAGLAILTLPTILTIIFLLLAKTKDVLNRLHWFFVGLFSAITVYTAIAVGLNPLQFFRTMVEPLHNSVHYFSGSANLNNGLTHLFQSVDLSFIDWIRVPLVVAIYGYVLWNWAKSVRHNNKDTLAHTLLALGQFILLYYTFATGRVHSRYGHMAIVLLLLLMPIMRLNRIHKIGLVGVLLFYFLNQVAVFATKNDAISQWVSTLYSYFPVWSYYLIVLGMVVSTLIFSSSYLQKKPLLTEK